MDSKTASNELVVRGLEALHENDYTEAFRLFREAADAGNVDGLHLMGICYVDGVGITKDVVQGTNLLWQCTVQNHHIAMAQLGDYFRCGKIFTRDTKQAVLWYQRAADAGNADAMEQLGVMYLTGEGVPMDIEKGQKLLLACGKLSQKALLEKLCMAYEQVGDKENCEKCHKELAEIGRPEDQYRLGMLYAKGQILPRNYEKARYWFEKSGLLDQVPDTIAIILMRDAPWLAMLKIYQTWAMRNNRQASKYAMNLHHMYQEGLGVEADPDKAAQWFYQAALAQNPSSNLPFYYRPDDRDEPFVTCEGGRFWQDDENYYLKLELETGCIEGSVGSGGEHLIVAKDDTSGVQIKNDLVIVSKTRYDWGDFVKVSLNVCCYCGAEDYVGCLRNQVACLAFRSMDAAEHFRKKCWCEYCNAKINLDDGFEINNCFFCDEDCAKAAFIDDLMCIDDWDEIELEEKSCEELAEMLRGYE